MGIFRRKSENDNNEQVDWPENNDSETKTIETDECFQDDAWKDDVVPDETTENTDKANANSEETNGASDLSQLLELVIGIKKDTASLASLFAEKIVNCEADEKTISLLHSDLQKHKNDLYAQLIKPLLVDIIGVRDGIEYSLSKLYEREDISSASTELLKDCSEQIE